MSTRAVVVTGAAGFIGAPTVRSLLDHGHRVLAWVRPEADMRRLSEIVGHPALELLELDLAGILGGGRKQAQEALVAFRPDVVVHAAWRGVRGLSRDDPAQVDNIAVGARVVELAAAAGTRRFVALGSQAEYGPIGRPVAEDDPTHPATLYGAAKLASCHVTLALARRLGLSAAWVRVFSLYGPGELSGALIPDLALALRDRRPFPLSPCEQMWDYLYVDDAVDALGRLAVDDGAQGIFNLASGLALPLREVVERVALLVAPAAKPQLGERPYAGGAPVHLMADVRRIRDALGWKPRVGLDEGLARTIAWRLGSATASGAAADQQTRRHGSERI